MSSCAWAYWQEHGLPTTVFRLFNTVGPRQVDHYGMVLPTFVRQALEGEPITVYGSGDQSRCFSAVQDVVEAWIGLTRTERSIGQVYNIGSDQEVSINQLAELVLEITGSDSSILRVPYETAYQRGFEDMKRRIPDVSRLRNDLGKTPSTTIREIVEMVVAYEQEQMPEVIVPKKPTPMAG